MLPAPHRRDTWPTDPQAMVLHGLVREHLATFLARRAEGDARSTWPQSSVEAASSASCAPQAELDFGA
jgi:hypothetical protein